MKQNNTRYKNEKNISGDDNLLNQCMKIYILRRHKFPINTSEKDSTARQTGDKWAVSILEKEAERYAQSHVTNQTNHFIFLSIITSLCFEISSFDHT